MWDEPELSNVALPRLPVPRCVIAIPIPIEAMRVQTDIEYTARIEQKNPLFTPQQRSRV
tara:strand:- start:1305 stop:1481 length:177 start_codon:yes stop_codon:yes gene_type:complete